MTDLSVSSEFQTYPNDPALWSVYSDWLLDHGDDSGAALARQKAAFWECVRESGHRPFEADNGTPGGCHCWAQQGFDSPEPHPRANCPMKHPARLPDELFLLLPEDPSLRKPRWYWQLDWPTEEGAWDALWRAWQRWSREATHE